jgi:hypothetical protein
VTDERARLENSGLRNVYEGEALAWLAHNPATLGTSVVTSLPDVSELQGRHFATWRSWFLDAAERVLRWIPAEGVAIFFQSDILERGVWVDKGYLVQRAAESAEAALVWHKVVCRVPPGSVSRGRAGYSHLLCFSRQPRPAPRLPAPDVLPELGAMPSQKAMGVAACVLACRYLLEETATRVVVDPFCGQGTLLAVANALGLAAIGVDRNGRACRAARKLVVELPPG